VADRALESLDALAQRRLRDPEIVRRAREAARFCGCDEVPQRAKFDFDRLPNVD